MARKGFTGSSTAKTPEKLSKSKGSRSDWAKANAMTRAAIEEDVAADPDEHGMEMDWENATIEMPQPKEVLNMRIDRDVLAYFRKMGRGYQTRINAVLRSYIAHREQPHPSHR
jgi:uncharacterized protein (DUF4415 family)